MSTLNDQLYRIIQRRRLETLFPWYAWDPERKLIFMNRGYVGTTMACNLLSGADDSLMDELGAALSINLPAGTFIQIVNWNVPDVTNIIFDYKSARDDIFSDPGLTMAQKKLLDGFTDNIAGFMTGMEKNGKAFKDSGVPLTQSMVLISIKVPTAEIPSDEHIKLADEQISAFQSSLNTFNPQRLSREPTLSIWRRFFNIQGEWEYDADDTTLLRDQILGPGDGIKDDGGMFTISHGDDKEDVISVLSIKGFSRPVNVFSTDFLMGDPLGKTTQLIRPAALVWTIHIPDQVKKRRQVTAKSLAINWQAFGRMVKWVPRIALKKEGTDYLVHALNHGEHALEMAFTAILWGRNIKEAKQAASNFTSHAGKAGFTMLPDKYLALPMFLNALPLFPDTESMGMTHRLKSVATSHATAAAPILVDWTGNAGQGRMTTKGAGTIFISRRGHVMLLDLYSSESGQNFVLAGMTRSGKTVTGQQIIMDQLALGAQVWVIEIGRGFEKLCKLFGGDHIDVRPDMDIGLNPFSSVETLDDELEELVGIIGTMISPSGNLSDSDMATIGIAIRAVYGANGTNATPTHVAQYLAAQDHKSRAIEMSEMMHEFTEHGAYGHWFNKPMNVDLTGRFVNLELIELSKRKHLMMVVLMQMMFAIARQISADKDPSDVRRRILFVDEASVLLKIPTAAHFLEGLARRVAKHRGALGIGIQGLSDLYANEQTRTIAAQTAHFIVMKQRGDTIKQLEKNEQFDIGSYGLSQMRTVRKTGEYAEAFIYSDGAMGVGRLKLDPYRRVLFSTEGPEKEEVLADMRAGMDPDSAIQKFMQTHPGYIEAQEQAPEEEEEDTDDTDPPDYLQSIAGAEAAEAAALVAKEALGKKAMKEVA
ncbi:type IV secretion system protein TraC [Acidithiobacillus ferriphilus]|uniref:type IV secretion system protein TraC n=1 Tax=Acidithiobacillus ferriphilus TaxID=1689834 RepID=UPI001C06F278|nr:type IV secretion system protein TraC [Acidithiobacillus ferriphilus]